MSSPLLVAAIDFGTTYSGWAFSFKHDFERDPTKITAKNWHADQFVSPKAPTCVLIKPDGKSFDSFGYTAESKYADLVAEQKHEKWYYFRRFKMMLFDKIKIARDVCLEDACGKQLPAKVVFSMVIKFLKDDLMTDCNKQLADVLTDKNVRWVLTVPAIWNDAAKQFMREAAIEAGILECNLVIALEPEAASIFCRHLPVERAKHAHGSLASMEAGTKYMVLDAGGGTVDITVHQVITENKVREVYKANGGDWGGTKVDEAYENFLASIIGSDMMKMFKMEHLDDHIDIFRSFEVKKRDLSTDNNSKVTIRIPPSLDDLMKKRTGKQFIDIVRQSKFGEKITYVNGKMRIDVELLQELFEETITNIIQHTKQLLKERSCSDCSAILMVGGFSESNLLQSAVRNALPGMKVIIPDGAGLVVLKGAVVFGHHPESITQRVCRYTYGLLSQHRTSSKKCNHPPTRTFRSRDGHLRCDGLFKIGVKCGQAIKMGEEFLASKRIPIDDTQDHVSFTVYASTSENPVFVKDKDCFKLGKLIVPIEDTSYGRNRNFDASFIFGGTEITVKVIDKVTGEISLLSIDCLE